MPLTAQDVAEIARLLEESDFEELRIEHEGLKLILRRGGARSGEGTAAGPAAAAPESAMSTAGSAAPGYERRAESAAPVTDPSVANVTAPFVGIFYRAPKPGGAPFVEVGSQVEEDTIIGIIEVMKLMNTVRAEVRGTVTDILVDDGAAVEYGQLLVRVARGLQRG